MLPFTIAKCSTSSTSFGMVTTMAMMSPRIVAGWPELGPAYPGFGASSYTTDNTRAACTSVLAIGSVMRGSAVGVRVGGNGTGG